MVDYLFVYGTLRQHANRYWHKKLIRQASFVEVAWFQGRLYKVNKQYPGVLPSPNAGDSVAGEVYRLLEPESTLCWLDTYENCGSGKNAEYRRCVKPVRLASGESVNVWIYLYNRKVYASQRISSGDFLKK